MEPLKHECGIALIRLRKPLEYFTKKHGTPLYALNKLYLLMQKQHNRGQEGAGAACVNLTAPSGEEFMFRERKEGKNAIQELFSSIRDQFALENMGTTLPPFIGECYMGHLRYSTTGCSGLSYIHPHLRRSGYRKNTLALCGNFNLTNTDEIFDRLNSLGQHPRKKSDTTILLEQLGHALDMENGSCEKMLYRCVPTWDGGFVTCGLNGEGEMFAVRDPWGIRTAFYYWDDEMIVVASERPAIQTILNIDSSKIKEIEPGEALFISSGGETGLKQIIAPLKKRACSFERIYFSRGNDKDIYKERKGLGNALVSKVLKSIDYDIKNTVFSFIPNTAETAFLGMTEGLNEYLNKEKVRDISSVQPSDIESISRIIARKVRTEKVAVKDIKLRTFISESEERTELANHVYDITYGSIDPNIDNLVVIDDSIVRGTTLKQSTITILSKLQPKKLVIVSSAPQIRYPDFYGIDMSAIEDLIAFRAVLELNSKEKVDEIYAKCKRQQTASPDQVINYVKDLYAPFSDYEISAKIADLITPEELSCPLEIIYQEIADLNRICAEHSGDWYFSGKYPTKGGLRLLNNSFIRFYEKKFLNL